MISRTHAIASALIAATVISAFAHSDATGIVKERMDLMKDISAHMKHVGEMIRGKRGYDSARVVLAGQVIAGHAERIPHKFPENTDDGDSEALPAIWENWDSFVELADKLMTNAEALSDAAGNATDADAIRLQFVALGRTCSACHEDFRKTD